MRERIARLTGMRNNAALPSHCAALLLSVVAIVFLLALLILLIPGEAEARPRTWRVRPDGSMHFTTIGEAVEAANENDSIAVYEGYYVENFAMTVPGVNLYAIEEGVYLHNVAGSAITILADNVNISGLIIYGGEFSSARTAIDVRESDNCLIEDCSISNFFSSGITLLDSSYGTIRECRFEYIFRSDDSDSGVIVLNGGSEYNLIENCTIDNSGLGESSYGILMDTQENGNVFRGLEINGTYGGIMDRSNNNAYSDIEIRNATGYGFYMTDDGGTISNCSLADVGCAFYLRYYSDMVTIENCTVRNATRGVFINGYWHYPSFTMVNNSFINTTTGFTGLEDGRVVATMANNTIDGKPIIYLRGTAGDMITGEVHSIYLFECQNITVREVNISGMVGLYNGIVIDSSSNITIRDSNISMCGVHGINIEDSPDVTIDNCTFYLNAVQGIFSSVRGTRNLTVTNCNFSGTSIYLYIPSSTSSFSTESERLEVSGNLESFGIQDNRYLNGAQRTFFRDMENIDASELYRDTVFFNCSDIRIWGRERGALQTPISYTINFVRCSQVSVENAHFNASCMLFTHFLECTDIAFRDSSFLGYSYNFCVAMYNASGMVHIDNCTFETGGRFFYLDGGEEVSIENSILLNISSSYDVIHLMNVDNVTVRDCRMQYMEYASSAIRIETAGNVSVSSCIMENMDDVSYVIRVDASENVSVSSCFMDNMHDVSYVIRVDTSENVSVSSCIMENMDDVSYVIRARTSGNVSITNCSMEQLSSTNPIQIYRTMNLTIRDIHLDDIDGNIYLDYCDEIIISGLSATGVSGYYFLDIDNFGNTSILDSYLEGIGTYLVISISGSDPVCRPYISNCTFIGASEYSAIRFDRCSPVIRNCDFILQMEINLDKCTGASILGNSFDGGGVNIHGTEEGHYTGHTLLDNTVGGKPLIYLSNERDQVLSEDGGQWLVFFSGNITIMDQSFYHANAGMDIVGCENVSVRDSEFLSGTTGLEIYESSNVSVERCVFTNGSSMFKGSNNYISGGNTPYLNISNCSFLGPYVGITLNAPANEISHSHFFNTASGIYANAPDNEISHCNFTGNGNGIYLTSIASGRVRNSTFMNNANGIHFSKSFHGSFNASENYWGNESGPAHPAANGTGDSVDERVIIESWYSDPGLTDLRTPDSLDDMKDDTGNGDSAALRMVLRTLLVMLFSLFGLLVIVVNWSPSRGKDAGKAEGTALAETDEDHMSSTGKNGDNHQISGGNYQNSGERGQREGNRREKKKGKGRTTTNKLLSTEGGKTVITNIGWGKNVIMYQEQTEDRGNGPKARKRKGDFIDSGKGGTGRIRRTGRNGKGMDRKREKGRKGVKWKREKDRKEMEWKREEDMKGTDWKREEGRRGTDRIREESRKGTDRKREKGRKGTDRIREESRKGMEWKREEGRKGKDKQKEGDSETGENKPENENNYNQIHACPHCGGKFTVESEKRPLRSICVCCHEIFQLE